MSCVSYKPFYNDSVSNWQENKTVDSAEIIYSVFLVGDARCAFSNNPVLKILEAQLKRAGKESAAVLEGERDIEADRIKAEALAKHQRLERLLKGCRAQSKRLHLSRSSLTCLAKGLASLSCLLLYSLP